MGMKNDVFGKDGMLHRVIGDKYESEKDKCEWHSLLQRR